MKNGNIHPSTTNASPIIKLANFNILTNASNYILDPDINEYKIKILQINNEIDELFKKISNANDILMKYINERIEKLDNEKECINKKLIQLLNKSHDSNICTITDYTSLWNKISLDDKILVVDALIKVIYVSDKKIKIIWKI